MIAVASGSGLFQAEKGAIRVRYLFGSLATERSSVTVLAPPRPGAQPGVSSFDCVARLQFLLKWVGVASSFREPPVLSHRR